jgi:methylated-DNA-protein-cysteine methyltransferase-like protein
MVSQSICGLVDEERAVAVRAIACSNPALRAEVHRTQMHEFATPEQRAAAILKAVRGIRRGTFASYGEVARRAGLPGRARLVGTVLRESGGAANLPWHRVTGAGGRIAFPKGSASAREQVRRLEREGVKARGGRVVQKPASASPRTLDAYFWKM